MPLCILWILAIVILSKKDIYTLQLHYNILDVLLNRLRKELPMDYIPMKDLNKHRICDRSKDKKTITIVRDGCKTIITANTDGTLNISFELVAA